MKAILVIDMPRDCEECALYDEDQMRCHYLKNDKYGVDERPKWCPLKPYDEDFMKEVANDYRRLK